MIVKRIGHPYQGPRGEGNPMGPIFGEDSTPFSIVNLIKDLPPVVVMKEVNYMYKIATIKARIESKLKIEAEAILNQVGLTSSEALRLFYKQICLNKGLPFSVKIPNKTTIKAMQEAENGKTKKVVHIKALFKYLKRREIKK